MNIKKILVPVTGADGGRPGLDAAFLIARHLEAHVEGLHARRNARDALAYVGEGMTGAMIEELIATAEEESEALAKRARRDFAAACEAAGFAQTEARRAKDGKPTAHLRLETGRADELVSLSGRVADLVVIARPASDDDIALRTILETTLLESGRPLFVVPPEGLAEAPTNLAIGWNGSAEAARAVAHAMPFLARAERVTVIAVEEGVKPGPSAEALIDYLAWHGVAATLHAMRSEQRSTGEILLADAKAVGAGALVMGAYTHSRLRRMIFGSATEHMLSVADIPVLMMH